MSRMGADRRGPERRPPLRVPRHRSRQHPRSRQAAPPAQRVFGTPGQGLAWGRELQDMNVLAIETTTDVCSVALMTDGCWFEDTRSAPRLHNRHVLAMIDNVLESAEITRGQIEVIAFGAGPGSFTGVRIAAAVAQGVALAVGARAVAVPSSTVAAECVRRASGRRGEITVARPCRPWSSPRVTVHARRRTTSIVSNSTGLPWWTLLRLKSSMQLDWHRTRASWASSPWTVSTRRSRLRWHCRSTSRVTVTGAQWRVLDASGPRIRTRCEPHPRWVNFACRRSSGVCGRAAVLPLARACGAGPGVRVHDALAGWGTDGLVLAALGCIVHMSECQPLIHGVLAERLRARRREGERCLPPGGRPRPLARRRELRRRLPRSDVRGAPEDGLAGQAHAGSGRAREHRRRPGGHAVDRTGAQAVALSRVVVKRRAAAPALGHPAWSIAGRSVRFDVYSP